jgi:ABC-type antimicrobial peptide transport system ATPase subunit
VRSVLQEKTTSIDTEPNISQWREEYLNLNIVMTKPNLYQQVKNTYKYKTGLVEKKRMFFRTECTRHISYN